MPPGPVDDGDHGLRRQRLELRRQRAVPLAHRPSSVDVGKQPLQLDHLVAQLRVARLRLLRHAFQSPLHVVAVGDEQLQLEPLEVAVRVGAGGETVHDGEQRVHAAQVAE